MRRTLIVSLACILPLVGWQTCFAAGKTFDLTVTVNDIDRLARVYEGDINPDRPSPLVLAFHGYGGNRVDFASATRLHDKWPEAIIVYPEGLRLEDSEGNLMSRGWQTRIDTHNNRDLDFIDALLDELDSRYTINHSRKYVAGFSNGGCLTLLLMSVRPDIFAAFASVGSTAAPDVLAGMTTPRPFMYIVGQSESERVMLAAERTVEALARVNRSTDERVAWAADYVLFKPEADGADLIVYSHRSGHLWPYTGSSNIVRFFNEHRLSADRHGD